MKESESNIKRKIDPEEVYRMYGISAEVVEERLKNILNTKKELKIGKNFMLKENINMGNNKGVKING